MKPTSASLISGTTLTYPLSIRVLVKLSRGRLRVPNLYYFNIINNGRYNGLATRYNSYRYRKSYVSVYLVIRKVARYIRTLYKLVGRLGLITTNIGSRSITAATTY